jgi:ribosomal protein L40E
MPNNKKDFSDKNFNCKNCRAHLATEKLDRQILVVGRLAIFNFASIVCMSCSALNLWQSPNLLPAKKENLLSRYPDKATDLPKPGNQLIERLSDARQVT